MRHHHPAILPTLRNVRYGYFQENNSYFICDNPLVIDRIFARLRNYDEQGSSTTPSYPKSIAGLEVTRVVDLTLGYDSTNPPTYKPSLPTSSGHMIQFRAASKDGVKIVLTTRTSGTEPKVRTRSMSVGGMIDINCFLTDQVLFGRKWTRSRCCPERVRGGRERTN
ncbi:hypothetical protein BC826DRAFT_668042 [Russula brevipes]|nr:hypothetical protein BC826DRAFT_668042 [Russula brevipes]